MKVLISDNLAEVAVQKMKEAGLEVASKPGMSPEELKAFVGEFDCLVVRSATKVTSDVIDAARNLKLIVRAGVGLDNVDVKAAGEKNIQVCNTPFATSITVAEHTFALLLALARKIPQAYQSLKSGEWNRKAFEGFELKDKTLAVIGLGRIGQEVAKRGKGFGMHVVANDRIADLEILEILEIEHHPLLEVLAMADFVTLHLPLMEDTYHLFDANLISKMKKGSYLINASRGGVVDEEALADALESGHLGGAALDVFEKEPVDPDNRLLKMQNVIAVPHLGASTKAGQERAGTEAADIIINFAKTL